MFPILPSCLAVNVRAETPNPMSSLVDPISSAFQEWRECLLEWTVDLNNKKYYQQKVLYIKMSEVNLIYLLWIHQTSQLLWDVDKLPLRHKHHYTCMSKVILEFSKSEQCPRLLQGCWKTCSFIRTQECHVVEIITARVNSLITQKLQRHRL